MNITKLALTTMLGALVVLSAFATSTAPRADCCCDTCKCCKVCKCTQCNCGSGTCCCCKGE